MRTIDFFALQIYIPHHFPNIAHISVSILQRLSNPSLQNVGHDTNAGGLYENYQPKEASGRGRINFPLPTSPATFPITAEDLIVNPPLATFRETTLGAIIKRLW